MGSYNITLTTSSETDTLFPIAVDKFNQVHGTNYTVAQYVTKICNEAIDEKTQRIMRLLGR